MTQITHPIYSLKQLIIYFFKLGATGFGGPIALVEYMHKDLVEQRKWISEEEFKQGLTLAQLAPGPLATQLGIYLGYVHYKILGGTLVGIAFVIPSFIMVVILGFAYKLYGGLEWMQAIFYGVGACVVGIIMMSSYRLTLKSIGKINLKSLKDKWMLWTIFLISISITCITKHEHIFVFIAAGILYMMIQSPPKFLNQTTANSLLVISQGSFDFQSTTLFKIAVFFSKAGAFVFGSGLAIIPFLHSGVVLEHHWLTEQQFLDSVAVAMITPGPVVITVGFIGYLVDGFSGACVAALATFLPCYLLTILPAPYFHKISKNESIKSFVEGISASVIGALVGAVFIISLQTIIDIPTAVIAFLTVFALLKVKSLKEPYIIIIAGILGCILKLV